MKKRFLSVLLTLVMLLSLLPTTALAADTYTVTVNGGTASPAGPNAAGTEVTVAATPPANMGFKQWNGLDGVTFVDDTNKQSATATFKMPARAVEATAVYGINNVIATASGNITPVLGNNAETNPTFTYNFAELTTMPNSCWRYSSDGEEWEYAGYTEATKKFCVGYWYFDLNAKLNDLSISDPCTVTVNGTKWQIIRPSVNLAAESPVYYLDAEGNVSVVMFEIDGVTATCPAMPESLSAEDTLPHLAFTPTPSQAVVRGDGTWQKKSGDTWVNVSGAAKAGSTYRYKTLMHIDSSVATHTFSDDVTLKVNGTSWTVDYTTMQEPGTSSVSVMVYSPEITVPAPKTPIGSVTISDLTKPVVGEMPDNSITVSGTGVAVDEDGSYWGRFDSSDSSGFSPYYSDGTTAVKSVVFRDGETYLFQLYLDAADGYEFTEDSEVYFAGKKLPAVDMENLSKSFAMIDPVGTGAVVRINMNDIVHVHVSGDWDSNETHHWHKCTAPGCDAGSDVTKLPDYAEHSFVNGLCTCGAHQHNWSAEWSVNATHHWHECSANGCTVSDNSGKDGYAAHDFTAGACVCGVEKVITSIEISGITVPVAGATPINSASVDKVGAEVDEESTFWVRYDASTGRTSDTYADGTSVHDTPFRDGETYLLQITIKPKTGYSFTADTKILYGGDELLDPDAANPTASCAALAPDSSAAMALINPVGSVAPKTLESIAITTPPTKTAYTAGESFDPDGMVVTATYSDSSTAPVDGYTVSPAGALSESDTEITVTYTEDGVIKTATQAITVTAVPAPQTATIVVKKTDNKDKALAGATFALTLPGSVAPTYTAVSNAYGLATFTGVADGSYTLAESAAPTGYVKDDATWNIYVTGGVAHVIHAEAPNGQPYNNEDPIVVVNTPIPAPDIVVWKTDGGQNYIAGASFALTKEGETTPAYTATSDENGKVLFEGVVDGTYVLSETVAPDGYTKSDATYKFLVENGVVYLYEEGDPVAYQDTLEIANEPIVTVTLPITKVVVKGGTSAPGQQTFTFEIKEFTFQGYDVSLATILENTITTNGVGSYEGVLKFTLPGNAANDILTEGIVIVEKNDGAANWTYDGTEWTAYANNAAAFGGQWRFLNDDIAPNGAERATFTNTYTKNASSGGGGSGSSGGSSGSSSSSRKPVLNKEDHMAFLQGYADGTFRPEKNMTRAQVTVMFVRLLVEKMEVGKTYSNSFSDVPADYWAANEIGYMEKFGIINGFNDGTFRPNDPVTRAQFAAIACRFEELTEGTKTFSDVPADHWAAKYISYAAERGWVGGFTDGTFRPNNYITRAQVAAVTCRLLERNADEKYIEKHFDDLTYTFSDMTEQHFAYWYALEASNGHDYTKKADKETWSSLLK